MPTSTPTPWTLAPPDTDSSKWYQGQGYQWTPNGWAKKDPYGTWTSASWTDGRGAPDFTFGGTKTDTTTTRGGGSGGPDLSELAAEYGKTGAAFGTGDFDKASEAQQSRLLTTALNAGGNVATEYANKARQAGGSGMGAGLVKAEAQVGARAQAGDLELKRQQFDASQREAAATHASQIASTLGSLRTEYLKSLISSDAATSGNNTQLQIAKMRDAREGQQLDESKREFNYKLPTFGQYSSNRMGDISGLFGTPFRDPVTGMPSNDPKLASPLTGWVNNGWG